MHIWWLFWFIYNAEILLLSREYTGTEHFFKFHLKYPVRAFTHHRVNFFLQSKRYLHTLCEHLLGIKALLYTLRVVRYAWSEVNGIGISRYYFTILLCYYLMNVFYVSLPVRGSSSRYNNIKQTGQLIASLPIKGVHEYLNGPLPNVHERILKHQLSDRLVIINWFLFFYLDLNDG